LLPLPDAIDWCPLRVHDPEQFLGCCHLVLHLAIPLLPCSIVAEIDVVLRAPVSALQSAANSEIIFKLGLGWGYTTQDVAYRM
jgi:hypothetical protein